jgi:hypothetical protein
VLWVTACAAVLGCQFGLTSEWSTDICRSFAGFSIAYDLLFLIFIWSEIVKPLHEQTADFTCACSWASSVAVMGLYASSVVGLSVFPSGDKWPDTQACLPHPLAIVILAFTLSSAVYTLILVTAAVIRINLRPTNVPYPQPPLPPLPPLPPSPLEDRLRGLSADQIAVIHVIQIADPFNAGTFNADAPPNRVANAVICAICLLECVGLVKRLECGHQYHADCIDNWLKRQNTCALCRRPAILLRPQISNFL